MTIIKKIMYEIIVLVFKIVLFILQILKQLVLPTRKRKGNILSSLFVFFVGTIGILNCFESGFFRLSDLFRQKHIRQGVLIVSVFLFLLSSLEWSAKQEYFSNNTINTELLPAITENNIITRDEKAVIPSLNRTPVVINFAVHTPVRECPSLHPPSVKKYLFIRSILF